jgi:hypothetical protein
MGSERDGRTKGKNEEVRMQNAEVEGAGATAGNEKTASPSILKSRPQHSVVQYYNTWNCSAKR